MMALLLHIGRLQRHPSPSFLSAVASISSTWAGHIVFVHLHHVCVECPCLCPFPLRWSVWLSGRDLIFMMSLRRTPVQEAVHRCCLQRWLLPVAAVPITHNSKWMWVGVVEGGMESLWQDRPDQDGILNHFFFNDLTFSMEFFSFF